MTTIDLSSYKNLYLETAKEFIASLKKNLETLSTDPINKAAIYEIFRSSHSLKSQNLAMGYIRTGQFCKVIEDYFHEINEGKISYKIEFQNILKDAIEKIEQSIKSIEQSDSELNLTNDMTALQKSLYGPEV